MDALIGGYSMAWNYSIWAPTPVVLGYSGGTYLNPVTGALGSRQNYPSYEADPGGDYYLCRIRSFGHNWQDLGPNRYNANAENPLITNCGNAPIIGSNGATIGNACLQVAPSFTRGNAPTNYFIAQRIIEPTLRCTRISPSGSASRRRSGPISSIRSNGTTRAV